MSKKVLASSLAVLLVASSNGPLIAEAYAQSGKVAKTVVLQTAGSAGVAVGGVGIAPPVISQDLTRGLTRAAIKTSVAPGAVKSFPPAAALKVRTSAAGARTGGGSPRVSNKEAISAAGNPAVRTIVDGSAVGNDAAVQAGQVILYDRGVKIGGVPVEAPFISGLAASERSGGRIGRFAGSVGSKSTAVRYIGRGGAGRISVADGRASRITAEGDQSSQLTGSGIGDMFRRLGNVIKSIFGALLRKSENPELLLNQIKDDIRSTLPKMNEAVVQTEKTVILLEGQIKQEQGEIAQFHQHILSAVKLAERSEGQSKVLAEEKARTLIAAKKSKQQSVADSQVQLASARTALEQGKKLRDQYKSQMEGRITAATALIAKHKQAQAKEEMARLWGSFEVGDQQDTYARVEAQVKEREAEAEARMRSAMDQAGQQLDPVDQAIAGMGVEDELADYRKQVKSPAKKVAEGGDQASVQSGSSVKSFLRGAPAILIVGLLGIAIASANPASAVAVAAGLGMLTIVDNAISRRMGKTLNNAALRNLFLALGIGSALGAWFIAMAAPAVFAEVAALYVLAPVASFVAALAHHLLRQAPQGDSKAKDVSDAADQGSQGTGSGIASAVGNIARAIGPKGFIYAAINGAAAVWAGLNTGFWAGTIGVGALIIPGGMVGSILGGILGEKVFGTSGGDTAGAAIWGAVIGLGTAVGLGVYLGGYVAAPWAAVTLGTVAVVGTLVESLLKAGSKKTPGDAQKIAEKGEQGSAESGSSVGGIFRGIGKAHETFWKLVNGAVRRVGKVVHLGDEWTGLTLAVASLVGMIVSYSSGARGFLPITLLISSAVFVISAAQLATESDMAEFFAKVDQYRPGLMAIPGVKKVEGYYSGSANNGSVKRLILHVAFIDDRNIARLPEKVGDYPVELRVVRPAADRIAAEGDQGSQGTGSGIVDMFRRLGNVIKSIFGALLRKSENPELLLNQYKDDIRSNLPKMNEAVVQTEKTVILLEGQIKQEQGEIAQFHQHILSAVKLAERSEGQSKVLAEEKARTLIAAKKSKQQSVADSQVQLASARTALEQGKKLRDQYKSQMEGRITAATALIAKHKQAQAKEEMARLWGSFEVGDQQDTYARVEAQVKDREAEAEARMRSAMDQAGQQLDPVDQAIAGMGVEDELAKYKEQVSGKSGSSK